ncbi:DUF3383 domain-containing protein [Bordetella sp. 02P26C-1]|uniref:DUF3383 domain-containing protein n=1 Tax=Bordetella sp. 02P26C-1 TaxID=2683195 RepID=UPI001353D0E3|nr:DUF3383 domain-containing protein [Bordetella sp. 02P26C-1]MVW80177.1 DUF3383 family protein [Bordetella sp. 02P26C-1]
MSIPASQIVSVIPGVIGAGGMALDMNGLILTGNTAVPVGTVQKFSTPEDVADFFGATSDEAALANVYFNGFNNSTKRPGALLFAQYPDAAVSGYLRGGSLRSMTLTQLKVLTGTLTVSVDGASVTSSTIKLTSATSFSAAATAIQSAFSGNALTVTYDAQRAAFVIASKTTGAASLVSFATGTLAAQLRLTQDTGAVVSAGAPAATPAAAMNAIERITQNWVAFTTLFPLDTAGHMGFSEWVNAKGDRYVYAGWDNDIQAEAQGSTTTWGAQLKAGKYSGSVPCYYPNAQLSAFVLGAIASIDFMRRNGRITLAFKGQDGFVPNVTDATVATTLKDNGYNFYGDYATANDQFQFFYPGQISGKWQWIDTYVNQVWLNNALQLALVSLLTSVNSIPYNTEGRALIDASCLDPIQDAVNFGAMRAGVRLSNSQKSQINSAAGLDISNVLQTQGYYLQVLDATPQVRAARGTPPMTLWYMDGGSVHNINLASIAVQ